VRVRKIKVVNVRRVDEIHVVDRGVPNVDVIDESPAAAEPWKEGFAKSEWEPANASAKTESKAATAKEANERRTVNWGREERPWAPAPPASEVIPSAVVEGSKAPRFRVNPAPAPRAHPIPITDAVGRPAHVNVTRIPDVSVFRLVAPFAVVIEVGVAGHVARDVLRGDRVVFLEISLVGPPIQTVGARRLRDAVFRIVSSIKFGALSGVDFIRLAASSHFSFATNHRDAARLAIFVNVNAESSGLLNGEGKIGCIHFVYVSLTQLADSEVDGALAEPHLDDAFVKIEEGKCRHAAQVDGRLASLQFGA